LDRFGHREAAARTRAGWKSRRTAKPFDGDVRLGDIVSVGETGVTFKWKDYRIDGPGRYQTMTQRPDRRHRL